MLNRIQPQMPVGAYKTYELRAPIQTHRRKATCEEAGCLNWRHGWATTVTPNTDDEATLLRASDGLIDGHRRHFTRAPEADGFVRYVFPPGQPCFRASTHTVPLEREPLYVVRGGDHRANTGTIRNHGQRADLWTEDFAEHQAGIAARIDRG